MGDVPRGTPAVFDYHSRPAPPTLRAAAQVHESQSLARACWRATWADMAMRFKVRDLTQAKRLNSELAAGLPVLNKAHLNLTGFWVEPMPAR